MTEMDIKWLAQVAEGEVREDTLEETGFAFPWAQWVNGKAELSSLANSANPVPYHGGWFAPADRVDDEAMAAAGWVKGELAHREGDSTEGWFTQRLSIAVFNRRRCWQISDDRRTYNYAWNQYDQAKAAGLALRPPSHASGRLQLLGFIRGLEQIGLMTLTMGGTAGMAFTERDGILATFKTVVIGAAEKASAKLTKKKKTYPRHYFWMTVGAALDAKGKPVFTKVGEGTASSQVTLPVLLGVSRDMGMDEIGKLYVGPELIALVAGTKDPITGAWNHDGLYDETLPWAQAWDAFDRETEPEAAQPEPVTEADFETAPF